MYNALSFVLGELRFGKAIYYYYYYYYYYCRYHFCEPDVKLD